MRLKRSYPVIVAVISLLTLGSLLADECTTAVVSGSATTDGRPLLWKNRDTDEENNKLVFLSEGPLAVVALVNAASSASVWMGVNEAGLAIENSASDDLEGTSGTQNGSFMKYALQNCATVDDFENLLLETNGSGRLTQANYGVIDAGGGAALFEVGNHTYHKFNATDPSAAPFGFIVRTDFAFTGDGSGTGHVRYDRAVDLLTAAAIAGTLSHDFLLRDVTRDLKNDAVDPYPLPYEEGQDGRPAGFIRTANSINRFKTRSSAVFHGVLPGDDPRLTTMWTILGEPVCSLALPVWPLAGSVPGELAGSPTAPILAAAIIKDAACYSLISSPEYIDTREIDDGLRGGIFSYTRATEDWILGRAAAALEQWRMSPPSAQTVDELQDSIALQAYWCFLASSVPNHELSAPRNLTCRTVENRGLFLREYIHLLNWQPPETGTAAGYRIYDVSTNDRIMLTELPAGTLSYQRRRVNPAGRTIYAVMALESDGTEGSPACVEPEDTADGTRRESTLGLENSGARMIIDILSVMRDIRFRGAF